MVGRIIVGGRHGPGTLPFDYFRADPAAQGWRAVPPAAQATFPPIEAIMAQHVVHAAIVGPASGSGHRHAS